MQEAPKGWNWGAFGLTWIWGIAHRTPIALLVFVPVLGWFGMPVLLGLKGNQWAWRNRSWPDVATFRSSQRAWAKGALVAWLGAVVAVAAAWLIAMSALKSSDAYQLAQAQLLADPKVAEVLGSPITFGSPRGSMSLGGGHGSATLSFEVSGPKAQGTVYVEASQALGAWRLDSAALELDKGARVEPLLAAP